MAAQPNFYRTDHPTIHRWMVAGSHYVTWFLGRNFPNAFPLVYVTGFPKSGTVWVTRMIADYFQMPYPHYSILPIGCHAVVHGHQRVPRHDARGAYVLRDGRDAMVSLYFHRTRSIADGDHPKLTRKQRHAFPGLVNKQQVRKNLPAFMERQFTNPFATQGRNWAQHVDAFLSNEYPLFAGVKYEDLLSDPHRALTETVEQISQEPADAERIAATVLKFSFQRQSGRKRGSEDRSGFLRKGTAGDWREYFTREAAEVFDRFASDALIAAGYESDREWINCIEANTKENLAA